MCNMPPEIKHFDNLDDFLDYYPYVKKLWTEHHIIKKKLLELAEKWDILCAPDNESDYKVKQELLAEMRKMGGKNGKTL